MNDIVVLEFANRNSVSIYEGKLCISIYVRADFVCISHATTTEFVPHFLVEFCISKEGGK